MSEFVYTENTRPDRPGIWMMRGASRPFAVAGCYDNWCEGDWCFICDLPEIKDPPKYREVRKGDEGEQIVVRSMGPYFFIGFNSSGEVIYENSIGHICACNHKDARTLDDGEPAKQPREWLLGIHPDGHVHQSWRGECKDDARRFNARGNELVRVREVIEEQQRDER